MPIHTWRVDDLATIGAMPARQPSPTLRLRRLAAELRRLRAEAGMTREDVFERTSINGATLYRIETVRARPQIRTLFALLDLYGVTEPDRSDLVALARRSTEQNWLQSFPKELSDSYALYIGFEGEAQSLLNYEGLFLPGLLQTEDYARAAIQRCLPGATKEEIQRLVETRVGRQAVFAREKPLRLWAIVDEAALLRPVGGRDVMHAQLAHLAAAAGQAHVTLQVLPYDVGAHPGMTGAFAVLQFDETAANDVIYIESQASELFLESETDVNRFTATFEHLRALALPPEMSVSLITGIARDMRGTAE
jgi:transcriptional regulator with XRE-family HTH domain